MKRLLPGVSGASGSSTTGVPLGSYVEEVKADNPAHFWTLGDSGSTAIDETGSSDGTYVNSPSQESASLLDDGSSKSVEFLGNDNSHVDTGFLPKSGDYFSVEWLMHADTTGEASFGRIISCEPNTGSDGFGILFNSDSQIITLWKTNTAGTDFSLKEAATGTTLHCLLEYVPGENTRLYLDGFLAGTQTSQSLVDSAATNLFIGNNPDLTRAFDGRISCVAWYTKPLSSIRLKVHAALATGRDALDYEAEVSDDSPLVYYRLGDPSSVAKDLSGFSDGTYVNSPSQESASLISSDLVNRSVEFPGNDDSHVDCGFSPSSGSSFSVEWWMFPDTIGESSAGRIASCEGSSSGFGIYLTANDEITIREDATGGFSTLNALKTLTGATTHCYLEHHTTNGITLYVDGEEVATASALANMNDATNNLFIGNNPDLTRAFDGRIDELAFYSGSLIDKTRTTPILRHYYSATNNRLKTYQEEILSDSPLHYWTFQDSTLSSIKDAVGESSQDGTYNGSPTIESGLVSGAQSVNFATSADYADFGDITNLSEPQTYSFFAKATGSLGAGDKVVFCSTHSFSFYYGVYVQAYDDGRIRIRLGAGGGSSSSDRKSYETSSGVIDFTSGNHFEVVVTDIDNLSLYIDGKDTPIPFLDGTGSSYVDSGNTNGYINRDIADSTEQYGVEVSDFSVFESGISSSRVLDHYKAIYYKTLNQSDVWTPEELFKEGELGAWWDVSDLDTMWQDVSGTTPAAVDSPVARIEDKSGNGNHFEQSTSADQPILRQDSNGKYYLEGDGSNFMHVPSSTASFKYVHDGTGGSVFVSAQFGNSSDPDAVMALLGNNAFTTTKTGFALSLEDRVSFSRNNHARVQITRSAGSSPTIDTHLTDPGDESLTPGVPVVYGFTHSTQTGSDLRVFVDGQNVIASGHQNSPSTSNSTHDLHLFQSASAVAPLTGRFYGAVLVDRVIANTERSELENWLENRFSTGGS